MTPPGARVELRGRNLPIGMPWFLGPEGWLPAGHLSLAFFPGAGARPRTLAGWLSRGGFLAGLADCPGDDPASTARLGFVEPPEGVAPAELFGRMEALLRAYNANGPLRYRLWPGPNSNGFARALVELSGGRLAAGPLFGKAPWRLYPGWSWKIDAGRFGQSGG